MAVLYTNLISVCENLKAQAELIVGLEEVVAAISAAELLNPAWELATIHADERIALLKELTGATSALQPDMNCYPRGYATAQCYDLDGHPIP